ncbi:MAG: SGNH/GDSL hydrolase family protein [Lentisphaerae bacterium]|nr:SGNH/GDSL hydrolase family protein [Lentisphaerota bacterium]
MKLQKGSKLLMIGDSITDAGRTRPVGEGLFDPLGRGYVCFVNALLGAAYPERGIRVVNMGCGGHTVRDLKARWQTDVLDLKPDWVSIMIGINDVWRQYDSPLQPECHVSLREYETTLRELVALTRPRVTGLIMVTPYYIESNRRDPMRATMDKYGAVVRKIADAERTLLVDTQAAMDRALKVQYPGALAWDRVHPNQVGHMILARAFVDVLGYAWK